MPGKVPLVPWVHHCARALLPGWTSQGALAGHPDAISASLDAGSLPRRHGRQELPDGANALRAAAREWRAHPVHSFLGLRESPAPGLEGSRRHTPLGVDCGDGESPFVPAAVVPAGSLRPGEALTLRRQVVVVGALAVVLPMASHGPV